MSISAKASAGTHCGNFQCVLCRIKKEQNTKESVSKKHTPTAAKTSGEAAGSDAKPKQRRSTGMDKTEKDVHHVLYKVIGQVRPLFMSCLSWLFGFIAAWSMLSVNIHLQKLEYVSISVHEHACVYNPSG